MSVRRFSKIAGRAAQPRSVLAALLASAQILVPAAALAEDPAVDPAVQQVKDQQTITKGDLEIQKLALDNAEAARALTEAKRKAIVDAFPASQTSGTTTVKDGAGQMEATALAAVATSAVAADIAKEIATSEAASLASPASLYPDSPCLDLPSLAWAQPSGHAPLLLVNSTDTFAFGHWDEFRFRACTIGSALQVAMAKVKALPEPRGAPSFRAEGGGAAAAVGTALSVGVKIAELLTPDWEVGHVTVSSTDRALMTAVAREYRRIPGAGPVYWAGQVSRLGGSSEVFTALQTLERYDREAGPLVDRYGPGLKAAQQAYDKVMKDDKATPAAKAKAKAALEAWTPVTELTDAQATYGQFLKTLNGKEGETLLPIASVVQEASMAKLLGRAGLVVSLSMQSSGGGYYSRKVIWNALFPNSVPYFVSGGVVVNYVAVRPADQQVYASGLFACSAGYVKLDKVAARTNTGAAPAALKCGQSGAGQ